jgi:hypothetical protein
MFFNEPPTPAQLVKALVEAPAKLLGLGGQQQQQQQVRGQQ